MNSSVWLIAEEDSGVCMSPIAAFADPESAQAALKQMPSHPRKEVIEVELRGELAAAVLVRAQEAAETFLSELRRRVHSLYTGIETHAETMRELLRAQKPERAHDPTVHTCLVAGQRLRAAREALGLRLSETAQKAGIEASALARLEAGKDVAVSTLEAAAKVLGASVKGVL